MYADDSTVYTSWHTPAEQGRALNEDLMLMEEWVAKTKEKTKCTVLGSKHLFKVTPTLHLTIGDIDIKQVIEAKSLGITVVSKMSWKSQIDQIVVKMGRSIRSCCKTLQKFCA